MKLPPVLLDTSVTLVSVELIRGKRSFKQCFATWKRDSMCLIPKDQKKRE